MIIEIALGIVLGVIILALLPYLLVGAVFVILALVGIAAIVLLAVYAPWMLAFLAVGASVWGIRHAWNQAVEARMKLDVAFKTAVSRRFSRGERAGLYIYGAFGGAFLLLFLWADPLVGAALIGVVGTVAGVGLGIHRFWSNSVTRAAKDRIRRQGVVLADLRPTTTSGTSFRTRDQNRWELDPASTADWDDR